jgi:hypothetical protein
MTRTLSVAPASTSTRIGRRIGQFAVGTFAGVCAAFVPRLTLKIGPQTGSTPVEVTAFPTDYLVAAIVFSLLIGGVALILEWGGKRSPRDTFLAALGVPALLTGVFTTANLDNEVIRQAAQVKSISDQRARDAGIEIDETPQGPAPAESGFLWKPNLMPTAFAQERGVVQPQQVQTSPPLGVRYREPRYWIVLAAASTTWHAVRFAHRPESRRILRRLPGRRARPLLRGGFESHRTQASGSGCTEPQTGSGRIISVSSARGACRPLRA